MPIFEYRCGRCDLEFELLVRSDTVIACPECASRDLGKMLSAPAVRSGTSLPISTGCPPPDAGPCGTGCCRL